MKKIFLLLTIVYSVNLVAQFTPQETLMPSALEPTDVVTADLNGDGVQDVLSISHGHSLIAWYDNLGAGEFGWQHIIVNDETYNTLSSLHPSDLDGDGDIDLVTASGVGNQLFWFENDGLGNFSDAQTIGGFVNEPLDLQIADINGDGTQDILLLIGAEALGSPKTMISYWNENQGDSWTQDVVFIETSAKMMQLADLDNDGDKDILIGATDNNMYWHKNDGLGNLAMIGSLIFNPYQSGNHTLIQVTIADMNQDGYLDILPLYQYLSKIVWIQNQGDGTFPNATLVGEGSEVGRPILLAIGDMNRDGLQDIVYYDDNSYELRWVEGIDSMTFGDNQVIYEAGYRSSIYLSKIDDNEYLDVLVTSNRYSSIFWHPNPTLEETIPILGINVSIFKGNHQYIWEDINQDGFLDLVGGNDRLYVRYNDQSGRFSLSKKMIDETNISSLAKADLNKDGHLDFVIGFSSGPETRNIKWYAGDGAQNWEPMSFDAHNHYASSQHLKVGDLDGDGDEDIALYNKDEFLWYANDGTGTFGMPNLIPLNVELGELWLKDIDADGDLDFLGYGITNRPRYWLNDGMGNFPVPEVIESYGLSFQRPVDLVDIDGDEDLDIVFIDLSETGIFWCENKGNYFQSSIRLVEKTEEDITTFDFTDIDEDGDYDLLLFSTPSSTIGSETKLLWYRNQEGVYDFISILDTYGYERGINIFSEDVNGDGYEDVFVETYYFHFNMYLYKNLPGEEHTLIEGKTYWDENENGVMDEAEIPLPKQRISLLPNQEDYFTNDDGEFFFYLPNGNYTLSAFDQTLWEVTYPTESYTLNLTEESEPFSYNFGFQPSRILPRVEPHTTSIPTRCNTTTNYYLHYSNTGTTIANGTVTLEVDELMGFVSATPEPDKIEGNTLIWHFSELYPSHENKIQLQFQMPDFNSIGEILETQATVQVFNENEELVYSKTTDYNSEVLCSYDPNDKLARSNLLGQSEFAYLADTILYTVRFQNTGNDTAFNIRIEDVLDKKLDWTTFHPITASHEYRTELNRETGLATFYFDDIMLPDSTTNEQESHGFVMFGIASLLDLQDKIEVDNTASIFFDFNPPIITNTATLTLIEQVETDIETLTADYSILIFPNPFSDFTTIEVNGLSAKGNYRLEVMDILGRKVRELKIEGGKVRLEREELTSGLYLIQVLEEDGNRILGSEKVLVE